MNARISHTIRKRRTPPGRLKILFGYAAGVSKTYALS